MAHRQSLDAPSAFDFHDVWEAAVAASPTGISLANASHPDMALCFVNPAFEDITGYRVEDVVGRNCRFLQGEDRDQAGRHQAREAIHAGRSSLVLLRNYKKSGELFWNELRMSPVLSPEREVTHFLGIQHDVTEREEAAASLKVERDRFEQLLEASDGSVWEQVEGAEVYARISPYVERLFGYPARQWTGEPRFWSEVIHPDDRDAVIALRRRARMTGATCEAEFRVQRADGQWSLVREVVSPATPRPGHPPRLRGLVRDVSDSLASPVSELGTAPARPVDRRSPPVVGVLSPEGRLLSAVSGWDLAIGAAKGSVEGRLLSELSHPDDRNTLHRALEESLSGLPGVRLGIRLRGGTGRFSVWEATLDRPETGTGVLATLRSLDPRQSR